MEYTDRIVVASHIPLLVRMFDLSEGDVLEVGTGYYSTTVLNWLSRSTGRKVYSYESGPGWYKRAKKHYETDNHKIIYCPDWDKADFDQRNWGLIFIDHGPNTRRIIDIKRLMNKTDYMVVHDTEPQRDDHYGYSQVLNDFKYRYDYKKVIPWTSVFSNFKSLEDVA